ncbi:MAG: SDR family oxidoreductase [Ilumatobacteraceae bacterium]|jgi:3-oxoacyl-[acyl-carrier protein] reductase|nr:SDR family oxidoreductase [Ilumatobacteraceae bacterium]
MEARMKTGSLEGKIVVVTGGGSGMGAAFSRRFADDGAHVVVNDVNEAAAGSVADEVSGEAAIFDVADSKSFDAAIDRVVAHHGRIDVLINNAGIAPPRNELKTDINMANQMKRMEGRYDDLEPGNYTVDLSDEQWDRMIKIHLYGTFYGTRAALRHMTPQRFGSIVNISSIMGLRPAAGAPHYSAAKAGIIAFTKSTAQEVAPFGVRVNAVCPGWVDTPLLDAFDEMTRMGIRMQTPIGRLAQAEELAQVVRFLAGPESSYCIGDVFPVSGGWV